MTGVTGAAAGLGLTKAGLKLTEASSNENRSVSFLVKGFTCVTCAIGLEVTLLKQKGVARAKASYPDGKVVVWFDCHQVAEATLQRIILDCGFSIV